MSCCLFVRELRFFQTLLLFDHPLPTNQMLHVVADKHSLRLHLPVRINLLKALFHKFVGQMFSPFFGANSRLLFLVHQHFKICSITHATCTCSSIRLWRGHEKNIPNAQVGVKLQFYFLDGFHFKPLFTIF